MTFLSPSIQKFSRQVKLYRFPFNRFGLTELKNDKRIKRMPAKIGQLSRGPLLSLNILSIITDRYQQEPLLIITTEIVS